MRHLPQGRCSIETTARRLQFVVSDSRGPDSCTSFDRESGVFARDGVLSGRLEEIASVEVQKVWSGVFQPREHLLGIRTGSGIDYLYGDRNEEKVVALASTVATFLGVELRCAIESATATPRSGADAEAVETSSVLPNAPTQPGASAYPTPHVLSLALQTPLLLGTLGAGMGVGVLLLVLIVGSPGSLLPSLFVCVPLTAGCLFFIQGAVSTIRRWQGIYAAQVPLRVVVTEVRRVDGKTVRCNLEYQYTDAAGRRYYGQSQDLSAGEAAYWHKGDIAEIVVNGNRPEDSLLVSARPLERQAA